MVKQGETGDTVAVAVGDNNHGNMEVVVEVLAGLDAVGSFELLTGCLASKSVLFHRRIA